MLKIYKYLILLYFILNLYISDVLSRRRNKISFGGVLTNKEIARHIVSIRVGNAFTYYGHRCGGSILSSRAILTAGHCAIDEEKKIFEHLWIIAGSINIKHLSDHAHIYEIDQVILHPKYIKIKSPADLVILRTITPIVEDGTHILRMNLANAPPKVNQSCLAAGWGSVNVKGPIKLSDDLLLVQQTIVEILPNLRLLHAGNTLDPQKAVQEGDSGSPLICNGQLVGIVSYRTPFQLYTFYVNVYEYRKWIEENSSDCLKFSNLLQILVVFLVIFFFFNK